LAQCCINVASVGHNRTPQIILNECHRLLGVVNGCDAVFNKLPIWEIVAEKADVASSLKS
jgi:hypothetical protein